MITVFRPFTSKFLRWIRENHQWLFSGAGVVIITTLLGGAVALLTRCANQHSPIAVAGNSRSRQLDEQKISTPITEAVPEAQPSEAAVRRKAQEEVEAKRSADAAEEARKTAAAEELRKEQANAETKRKAALASLKFAGTWIGSVHSDGSAQGVGNSASDDSVTVQIDQREKSVVITLGTAREVHAAFRQGRSLSWSESATLNTIYGMATTQLHGSLVANDDGDTAVFTQTQEVRPNGRKPAARGAQSGTVTKIK